MDLPVQIKEQWKKPVYWDVKQAKDSIEISDEEGDFVVRSMTTKHISESIDEHIKNVTQAATLELLLAMSDDHEG